MAELSRVKKYKDLRDRLEEETTETSSNTKKEFSRSSKKSHESLSHANQPVRAHQQTKVKPNNEQGQKSPLMDDLIDEVKQYNIDNGNIVSDDTQINILKQLDGTQIKHRNSHFIPMEEDEESLGSTMKLPVSEIEEAFPDQVPSVEKEEMEYYEEPAIDNGPDILPISETPKKVTPLEQMPKQEDTYFEEDDIRDEEEIEEVVPTENVEDTMEQDTKEQIVLTHEDYQNAYEQQELTTDEALDEYFNEEDVEEQQPKPRQSKKEKTKKTKMPSEKKKEEVKTKKVKTSQQRSNMILNIILAVLIIALIIAIGITVYYISRLG